MQPQQGNGEQGSWTQIFVYGTLKRGFTNYQRYLSVAEKWKKAEFVGTASTGEKYPLVIRPMHISHVRLSTRGPVLLDKPGDGHHIHGEVYRVDADTLAALDILEGVAIGGYYKKVVQVTSNESEAACTCYFYPSNDELLSQPMFPNYQREHHELYCPPPVRMEIARLVQPADSHGLQHGSSRRMGVLCLRLLPGDDLLGSLLTFAKDRQLAAAVVLSCVGSTARTTLRPAGCPEPRVFEGKFEIVSLTGTLGLAGHHLHMAVSDAECRVLGGHLLEGCTVRTTAEIALGVLEGLEFSRPTDARTGYDELSISELPLGKRPRLESRDDSTTTSDVDGQL